MDIDSWVPPTKAEMKLIEARRERSDRISKLMSGYLLKGYKMLGSVCSECETILLQDRQGTNYCVACSEMDSDTDKDNPLVNQAAAKSMVKETELSTLTVQASEPKPTEASQPESRGLLQNGHAGAEADRRSAFSGAGESAQTVNTAKTYTFKEQNGASAPSELYAKQETLLRETDSDSGVPSLTETHALLYPQHRKRPANTSTFSLESPTLPQAILFEKIDWATKELKDAASVEYSVQLCHLIKTAAEALVAVRNARI